MRLLKIQTKGLTRFKEAVTLDLTPYGPGLVAIVGENGSGKTTLLEAVAVALYKTLPSRPRSLYNYANGADAFASATLLDSDNNTLEARVSINGARNLTESYLFENGKSLTSGRAAEFAAEVEKRSGSEQLFLASVFSAQDKAGNFLTMPKARRKELFAELLSLEHLGAIGDYARRRKATLEKMLDALDFLLHALDSHLTTATGPLKESLEKEQLAVTTEIARTAELLKAATANVKKAGAELIEARQAQETLHAAMKDWDRAILARRTAATNYESVKEQQRRAAKLTQAHQRSLTDQIEALDEEAVKQKFYSEKIFFEQRIDRLKEKLKDEGEADKAIAALPALNAKMSEIGMALLNASEIESHVTALSREIEAAEKFERQKKLSYDRHLESLRKPASKYGEAPCTAAETWASVPTKRVASKTVYKHLAEECPVLSLAREAKEQLSDLPEYRPSPELDALRDTLSETKSRLPSVQELERLKEEAVTWRKKLDEASQVATTKSQFDMLRQQLEQAEDDLKRLDLNLKIEIENTRTKRAQLLAELDVTFRAAEEEDKAYIARFTEAERTLREAIDDEGKAEIHYKTLSNNKPSVPVLEQALTFAEQLMAEKAGALKDLQVKTKVLAAKIEDVEQKEFERTLKLDERAMLAKEVASWGLLEEAFGKDGIQALEIDAAGPEIAKLTNELLTSCYGPRFSISFETLRMKRDGDYTEVFDVKVFDGKDSREFEALSGGEKVIVAEAIGLAFGIYNKRKSGIKWETLFRDETASALDPDNAQAYIQMLRRALALGGFYHILFVSHVPEVWQAADVQFKVSEGKVAAM